VAPAGSGHNFVYENAEFTIGVMRDILLGTNTPSSGPTR
jgi:hypothetical protein